MVEVTKCPHSEIFPKKKLKKDFLKSQDFNHDKYCYWYIIRMCMSKSERDEFLNLINEIKTYIHNIDHDIPTDNVYISQLFINDIYYADMWKNFLII